MLHLSLFWIRVYKKKKRRKQQQKLQELVVFWNVRLFIYLFVFCLLLFNGRTLSNKLYFFLLRTISSFNSFNFNRVPTPYFQIKCDFHTSENRYFFWFYFSPYFRSLPQYGRKVNIDINRNYRYIDARISAEKKPRLW